jgi:hypothetical protein
MKLMIDLETLGSNEDAMVLEIGWCVFDDGGILTSRSFIVPSKLQQDRSKSLDTLNWCIGNGLGDLIDKSDAKPIDLDLLAVQFGEIAAVIKNCSEMWCYGASFDFPILKHLLANLSPKYVENWDYRKERCLRTWCALNEKELLSTNTHRAKDDVENQARTLIAK